MLLFITLLVFAPPARRERFTLDKFLERRIGWWRFVAEPHSVDRVHGSPVVEPVVVGETSLGHGPLPLRRRFSPRPHDRFRLAHGLALSGCTSPLA